MLGMYLKSASKATALGVLALAATFGSTVARADDPSSGTVLRVWPGDAPGAELWSGAELAGESPSPAGKIEFRQNVSVPTLTVVRPAQGQANGTAMLVLPGGAFVGLAWNLEGTDVARWLASRGITAFVLKYRVRHWPVPAGVKIEKPIDYFPVLETGRNLAVADASEAVRLVRKSAAQYGIRPDRVGMIGFSAGAITSLGVVFESDASARPDFVASIYGMTMLKEPKLPADAPPLFMAVAQDDGLITPEFNQQIYALWSSAKRPIEMHVYEQGGHGFGIGTKNLPVDAWPRAFEAWLQARDLIPKVRLDVKATTSQ